MKNVKVQNMTSDRGNDIPNQFIIRTNKGTYFQSYDSIIVFKPSDYSKPIQIDEYTWDYSRTTGKYRNQFLGESKPETEKKIKNGTYKLTDLNKKQK